MPWTSGTATDYIDLLDRLRRYACGYATWDPPTFVGSGPGTMESIDTYPSTPTETWTISCTDATTSGAEVWSVTGSVSGAQADATTGVAYDNGIVRFTITGSGYAVGDEFTLNVSEGELTTAGQAWTEHRWIEPADAVGERELIIEGPGLSNQDQVFAGIRSISSVTDDFFNWRVVGLLGYSATETWDFQPGRSGERGIQLWDSSIPFWLVVNGRRIVCVAKISTTYQLLYLGLMLPYALPDQYGYPFVVGGTRRYTDSRWSEEVDGHRYCIDPGDESMLLRLPAGAWYPFSHINSSGNGEDDRMVWPPGFNSLGASNSAYLIDWLRPTDDGVYALLPCVLHSQDPSRDVFGEFDGVYWVPGAGISAEDVIQYAGQDHLVVPNIYRSGLADYAAVRLE